MSANTRDTNQRYQRQERPPGNAAAYLRDFAAVANRSIDAVLIENLNIALRLLWGHRSSGV